MQIWKWGKLIISILVCELAGVIGAAFTTSSIPTWYAGLIKPALNPPSWLFGPVWVALYALMGISLFLIWEQHSDILPPSREATDGHSKNVGMLRVWKKAVALFFAQLALNAIWSPIFFGARSIGSALAIIVLLWAAIILTILVFKKISRPAAWLLLPYILWVSFALYLNLSILILN